MTVGIYELEPFLPSDITAFKSCYAPAITASVTAVSVDGANPNAGPGAGEAALDIEMVIGMAPNVNVQVYVGPNGGSGPLDTYVAMVERQRPAPGDLHQLGPVRGAAAAGLHPGRGVDLPAGRGPGPDRRGGRRRRGVRGLLPVPELHRHRASQVDDPASQPWVTGVGGTTLNALGPAAERVGVELGSVQRHGRGRDLDDVDHAGVAARPRCPERRTPRRRTPSPGPSRAR